jgi:hypothetical protein
VYWSFELPVEWRATSLKLHLHHGFSATGESSLSLRLDFDPEDWNYPWSVGDFGRAFVASTQPPARSCRFDDGDYACTGIILEYKFPHGAALLSAVEHELTTNFRQISEATNFLLIASVNSGSLVRAFRFPAEHQVACKQYLVYFGEFLALAGVEAKTQISDEETQVLFAVTPTDGKPALARVRAALDLYLALPNRDAGQFRGHESDARLARLVANIDHFRKCVGLGEARTSLQATVTAAPADDVSKEKTVLWGGRVAIKKWSRGPFEIDLPKIIEDLVTRFPILRKVM